MSRSSAADRLELALEMYALGESMKRHQLRRLYPEATDAELEARLRDWLQRRPGAEAGDAPGRPRPLPRGPVPR